MLANTESEVASLGEVFLSQFVFLHFEPALKDLFGLGTTDSDVNSDLFVTSDAECSDGVAGFACREERKRLEGAQSRGRGELLGRVAGGNAYCRQAFDQTIVQAL